MDHMRIRIQIGAAPVSSKNENIIRIVPDKEEPDAGEMYIIGVVNGDQVDFLIDTGATFTSVVGVESVQQNAVIRESRFQGIGGVAQVGEVITVGNFSLAGHPFLNQEVVRAPKGQGRKSTIGVDLFKGRTFGFQFKERKLSFLEAIPSKANAELFEIGKRGHIYLPVQIETTKFSGLWDTGAGLTLIDPSVIRDNPSNFTLIKKSSGGDTTGSTIDVQFYKMKSIKIDKQVFNDVVVLSVDLAGIRKDIGDDVRVLLGFNLLIQCDWFFDMGKKQWSMSENY